MRARNSKNSYVSEINVVPYIDVMLVLLVIFMITAPMLTQGVVVKLPEAESKAIKTAEKEPIIVSVNKNGEYFLNISASPNSPISEHNLLLRVAAELELAKSDGDQANVLVKGDEGVPYGKVVVAMGLLKKAGASQVGLLTSDPKRSMEEGTA